MAGMFPTLAYASNADLSQSNFVLLFAFGGGILLVCILAAVVIVTARRRAIRHADNIITVAIFWGLLCVGSVGYAAVIQIKWAQENLIELQSGYGDPNAAAPALPWLIWCALLAVYLLVAGWTFSSPSVPRPEREVDPE